MRGNTVAALWPVLSVIVKVEEGGNLGKGWL